MMPMMMKNIGPVVYVIIIEPIRDICFPANTNDLYNLLNPNWKLNLVLILKNNKQAANKIEIAAEYWGV